MLEAADRFCDALIAASSRAAPGRCSPKSYRPFIRQAGLGQVIPGKVSNLEPLRISNRAVAVNILCRAMRSVKTQPVKYLRPDRLPWFQAQTPGARRKLLRDRTRAYFPLQEGCHNGDYASLTKARARGRDTTSRNRVVAAIAQRQPSPRPIGVTCVSAALQGNLSASRVRARNSEQPDPLLADVPFARFRSLA